MQNQTDQPAAVQQPRFIEVLFEENNVISSVLNAIEKESINVFDGEDMEIDFWSSAATFLEKFAQNCHHKKEEAVLIPALLERGLAADNSVIVGTRADHKDGIVRLHKLRELLTTGNPRSIAQAGGSYAFVFREHLQRENMGLYPIAQETLSNLNGNKMLKSFQAIEREAFGTDGRDSLIRLGKMLCQKARIDFYGMKSLLPSGGGCGEGCSC